MDSTITYSHRSPLHSAARRRKLFAPLSKISPEKAAEQLKSVKPEVVQNLVLRAGQEALRCSGPGWYPESDIRVTIDRGRPLVLQLSGFKRLELSVNPGALLNQCAKLHKDGIGANPIAILENTAGALVRLFAGYYAICPWDAWRHRNLVNAACWGAYRTQWVSGKEKELAAMVALFFEKSVVAHALTEDEGPIFIQGVTCERLVSEVPYHLLTALFERTQSMLFPKAWRPVLPTTLQEANPVADALLADVMYLLFGGRVRSVRGGLRLRGKTARPKSWEWTSRVEHLAELLVPYLEREEEGDGPGGPNPFPPGDGPDPAPPPIGPNPFGPGEDLDPSLGPPLQPQPGGPLPGAGPPRPPRFSDFEAIDQYYSERANRLVLRDQSDDGPQQEPERITVGYLDAEEASLLDLVSGRIDWVRTRKCAPDDLHPTGLQLFRRTEPLDISADADKPAPHGLPHLLIAVDSSGSMCFDPAAEGSARGQYDLVLHGAWGMFRYIQECEEADKVKVNALNFSSATITSGWHPCSRLQPVKEVLATYYGGGTSLDVAKLNEAHETRPGEFLAVVITDGGLGNTAEALAGFKKIVQAGNHLVLLHVGKANAFTKGIEDLGCPTHLLNRAEDLVGLCLDLAKSRYAQEG